MMSGVQITVLVDNDAGEGLRAEHGLSLWIETAGRRILFDTGQGDALLPNARQLGVRLEEADVIVLSHGHYDHSDGLPDVISLAPAARLIAHRGALVDRYSLPASRPAKAIGLSEAARAAIAQIPDERVTWSPEPVRIADNVHVTGPIARETPYEDVGGPFFLDEAGRQADPIGDDQALWIETGAGVVVCVGCCHAGLINTLRAVQRVAGVSSLRAVIGGFHLLHANEERLARTIAALRSLAVEELAPCHCTGKQALRCLQEAFGARVSPCRSGRRFRFAS